MRRIYRCSLCDWRTAHPVLGATGEVFCSNTCRSQAVKHEQKCGNCGKPTPRPEQFVGSAHDGSDAPENHPPTS